MRTPKRRSLLPGHFCDRLSFESVSSLDSLSAVREAHHDEMYNSAETPSGMLLQHSQSDFLPSNTLRQQSSRPSSRIEHVATPALAHPARSLWLPPSHGEMLAVPDSEPQSSNHGLPFLSIERRKRSQTVSHRNERCTSPLPVHDITATSSPPRQRSPSLSKILHHDAQASQRLLNTLSPMPQSPRRRVQSESGEHAEQLPLGVLNGVSDYRGIQRRSKRRGRDQSMKGGPRPGESTRRSHRSRSRSKMDPVASNAQNTPSDDVESSFTSQILPPGRPVSRRQQHVDSLGVFALAESAERCLSRPTTPQLVSQSSPILTSDTFLDVAPSVPPPLRPPRSVRRASMLQPLQLDRILVESPPPILASHTLQANTGDAGDSSHRNIEGDVSPTDPRVSSPPSLTSGVRDPEQWSASQMKASVTQSTQLSLDPRSEDGLAADIGMNVNWEMLTTPLDLDGVVGTMQSIEHWRQATDPFVVGYADDKEVFIDDSRSDHSTKEEVNTEKEDCNDEDDTYSSSFWAVPPEIYLATTELAAVESSQTNSTLPSAPSTVRPSRYEISDTGFDLLPSASLCDASTSSAHRTDAAGEQLISEEQSSPYAVALPGSFVPSPPDAVDGRDGMARCRESPNHSNTAGMSALTGQDCKLSSSNWAKLTRSRSESSTTEFQSAEEGSEQDWSLQTDAARQSISWFEAAEAFERQHGCARGSASWRTSIRFSVERRSLIAPAETRDIQKRLSIMEEKRLSKLEPSWEEELEHLAGQIELPTAASTVLMRQKSRMPTQQEPACRDYSTGLIAVAGPGQVPLSATASEKQPLVKADTGRQVNERATQGIVECTKAVSFEVADTLKETRPLARRVSQRTRQISDKRKSVQARNRLTDFMMSVPLVLVEAPVANLWRSTLTAEQHEAVVSRFGTKEVHRQEVIWELCETETSFVQSLCSIQRLFALPLRSVDGRWVDGVPCVAARLFDWLEDILSFHQRLSAVLAQIRSTQSPIMLTIADTILRIVPRLEVHQPYLVRFEESTQQLEAMVKEDATHFGTFLRTQLQLPECGNLPLSSFLLKPIQRLMKYPLFFRQLQELTPDPHPDYAATKQLHTLTESLIRDMNNVKAREEEYSELKELQGRLYGLPPDMFIATRDRKLIHQGSIVCTNTGAERLRPSSHHSSLDPAPEELRTSAGASTKLLPALSGLSELRPSALTERPARIERAGYETPIQTNESASYWSDRRDLSDLEVDVSGTNRSDSPPNSMAQRQVESSIDREEILTRISRETSRPRSLHLPSRLSPVDTRADAISVSMPSTPTAATAGQSSTTLMPSPRPIFERKSSAIAALLLRSSKAEKKKERANDRADVPTSLHLFVFTDMVLLTTVENENGKDHYRLSSRTHSWGRKKTSTPASSIPASPRTDQTRYRVLNGIGLSRVLGVSSHSEGSSVHLSLSLLPLKPEGARRTNPSGTANLQFVFAAGSGDGGLTGTEAIEQACVKWTRALERSLLHSIRISRKQAALLTTVSQPLASNPNGSGRLSTPLSAHSDWPRRAQQVTELVTAAARAGDRTNLVALLQSGLPFPKSPSQQDLVLYASEQLVMAQKENADGRKSPPLSAEGSDTERVRGTWTPVGMNVLDEVEEDREERRWWALRLAEVRKEMMAEKEVDEMVERSRSEERDRSTAGKVGSSCTIESGIRPAAWTMGNFARSTIAARRKGRGGLPVLLPNSPKLDLGSSSLPRSPNALSSPSQPLSSSQMEASARIASSKRPGVPRPFASSPTVSQFPSREDDEGTVRAPPASPLPKIRDALTLRMSRPHVRERSADRPSAAHPALPPGPPTQRAPQPQPRPPTPPNRSTRRRNQTPASKTSSR